MQRIRKAEREPNFSLTIGPVHHVQTITIERLYPNTLSLTAPPDRTLSALFPLRSLATSSAVGTQQ